MEKTGGVHSKHQAENASLCITPGCRSSVEFRSDPSSASRARLTLLCRKDLGQACGMAGVGAGIGAGIGAEIGLRAVLSCGTMTACGGQGSEPGRTGNNHRADREGQAGRAVTKDQGSMLGTDGREHWQGIHMNEGKCKHVTRAGGVGGSWSKGGGN